MSLLRLAAYTGGAYLAFLVAFPDWTGELYHWLTGIFLAGLSVGLYMLFRFLDMRSRALQYALELGFALLVAVYLSATLPQASGKSPLEQWADGSRPNQSQARQGLRRLGADPGAAPFDRLVGLFPKG